MCCVNPTVLPLRSCCLQSEAPLLRLPRGAGAFIHVFSPEGPHECAHCPLRASWQCLTCLSGGQPGRRLSDRVATSVHALHPIHPVGGRKEGQGPSLCQLLAHLLQHHGLPACLLSFPLFSTHRGSVTERGPRGGMHSIVHRSEMSARYRMTAAIHLWGVT